MHSVKKTTTFQPKVKEKKKLLPCLRYTLCKWWEGGLLFASYFNH